ncbi:hypothetical protein NLJ89_g7123 [Agrocybe chaxingu]|uniref:Uncharacterized protein n=1 Tax=Agrocybe chaxingu TaxID=84603 RepID=A0A9W8JXA0_9AGAR|nr:hypothetical protein NLJ89_g7123 [Agrocybe chaxingu]
MNTTSSSTFDVPNPLTPLAYLQPGIAAQVMIGTCIHMGVLGIVVWDALHNIRNDYLLATKHRFEMPMAAYFLSRIACFTYGIGPIPIVHCRRLELAVNSFLTVSLCLNTLLFYIRVCAVYYNKNTIALSFGLFWLATVGMASLVPRAMTATHIGPAKHCTEIIDTHSLIPTYLVFFAYDSAVFAATSNRFYRLYTLEETSLTGGMRVIFLVPVMQLGIVIGAFCFAVDTPGLVVISELVPVHVMLGNVVTCCVFRNTKLGLVREPVDHDFESSRGARVLAPGRG